MNTTDVTPAADRGSECNALLGQAPERATMRLTLADLGVLADTAERNGTVRAFPAVALQWAAGARAEIERLREVARDAAEAATKHQAEVLLLRAALEEIANGPNRLTDTVGEVLYRMRDIAKQALKA